jgi:hypothetical protein
MSLSELKEEIHRLSPDERRELTNHLLDLEEDHDEEWLAEMLRRARLAAAGQGLVSQEEVEALHLRLLAEGR